MGLDELVNNNSSEEKEKKKTESKSKNKEEDAHDGGQKTLRRTNIEDENVGPDSVEVKDEEYPVSPLQCKTCQNGMAAYLSGIATDRDGNPDHGALTRCTRVFCEDSIFNLEDPPLEFDRMEIFVEMNERIEDDSRINSW